MDRLALVPNISHTVCYSRWCARDVNDENASLSKKCCLLGMTLILCNDWKLILPLYLLLFFATYTAYYTITTKVALCWFATTTTQGAEDLRVTH